MKNLLIAPLSALALALGVAPASAQVRIGGFIGIGFGNWHNHGSVHAPYGRPVHHCVAGYWQTIDDKVWVPGECVRVWVAPCYEDRIDRHGHRHSVVVRAGYWREQQLAGHWETRCRKVWVPGCGCRY